MSCEFEMRKNGSSNGVWLYGRADSEESQAGKIRSRQKVSVLLMNYKEVLSFPKSWKAPAKTAYSSLFGWVSVARY
jgi:hypothetical protein